MATWEDLKELRLRICDPFGVIAIEKVADAAALKAISFPAKQVAYLQEDSGEYYTYDSDLAAWNRPDLELSDPRLDNLIDLWGVARAAPKAVRLILGSVGKRLGILRSGHGAEQIQYQTLADTYAYYKGLAESMDEEAAKDSGASTGGFFSTRRPRIGGGGMNSAQRGPYGNFGGGW